MRGVRQLSPWSPGIFLTWRDNGSVSWRSKEGDLHKALIDVRTQRAMRAREVHAQAAAGAGYGPYAAGR